MKHSLKILIVLELLIIPLLMQGIPTTFASEGADPQLGADNKYHIRIELSQWEIKAYDLVHAEEVMGELGVTDLNEGFVDGKFKGIEIKHRIGSFEPNSTVVFDVVTRDVQHGFSINEVKLAIASIRPEPGETFGLPRSAEFTWPAEDVTISAFCHIFCGLGHPDMKLKFIIGEGSAEYGPPLFYAVVVLNILIFGFVANKIWTKLD